MKKIIAISLMMFGVTSMVLCKDDIYIGGYGYIKVDLTIGKIGEDIIATIIATNVQDFDLYIPNSSILTDKIIFYDEFKIFNEKKVKAIYTGMLADSIPPTIEDCFVMKPNETISFSITLTKRYRLPKSSEYLTFKYYGPLGKSNLVVMLRNSQL